MDRPPSFEIDAVSMLRMDRLYRVFVTPERLYFLRLGPGDPNQAVTSQFGLVGGLIGAALQKRARRRREEATARAGEKTLDERLAEHKQNFAAAPSGFVEARIDPWTFGSAAWWGMKGKTVHAGLWRFTLAAAGSMTCLFPKVTDMQAAVAELPKVLGGILVLNVTWDEQAGRFRKKVVSAEH